MKNNPRYDDIKIIFVGPFGYAECTEILVKYINANDLEKNITFTGGVDHDVVREYMSCSIHVIGSYMPTIKKYITAYNSGVIINLLDENDIAKNIEMLLEDKDLIKLVDNNGMKAISEEFNWKEEEKKLMDIYKFLGGINNENI